jgi:hypothetical protein
MFFDLLTTYINKINKYFLVSFKVLRLNSMYLSNFNVPLSINFNILHLRSYNYIKVGL